MSHVWLLYKGIFRSELDGHTDVNYDFNYDFNFHVSVVICRDLKTRSIEQDVSTLLMLA